MPIIVLKRNIFKNWYGKENGIEIFEAKNPKSEADSLKIKMYSLCAQLETDAEKFCWNKGNPTSL